MIRVLFLSNVPWDFVWQRHQTLASLWARDSQVDYVELPGMRRVTWRDAGRIWRRALSLLGRGPKASATDRPAFLRVVRPVVLPATNACFCAVNARLLDRLLSRDPRLLGPYDLTVIYTPARTALQWLDRLRTGRIVYDCTDDLTAVRGVPGFFAADERQLLGRADLTVVPSQVLLARKRDKARRIACVPHGAQVDRFLLPVKTAAEAVRPTLLYYGHLHRQHLDFTALDALARARPQWRLILIGPVRTPHAWPANVELPGQVEHGRLAEWISRADVLLLPYVINNYTEAVMPAKTYECLATGLPVVASPLPELAGRFAGMMSFVSPGGDWAAAVEAALAANTVAAANQRRALALANTWELRFEELSAAIAAAGEVSA